MPVLSTRIVLDCFYLLILYSEKFSTDVCRLPYAVNVNLYFAYFFETGEPRLHKPSGFFCAPLQPYNSYMYSCIALYFG